MTTTTHIDNYKEITRLLTENYIKGAISGNSNDMKPAFHKNATWYGYVGDDLIQGAIQGLYDWHDDNGAASDLVYSIVKIDIVGNIANVKVELDNWTGYRFTDLLNLLKIDGQWQVMNKVFYLHS